MSSCSGSRAATSARSSGARQLGQVPEPEVVEELLGGAVEERTSHDFRAPADGDEVALEQGGEHRARVHAADRLDLALRDRLFVGDDRHGLERRARQPHALPAAQHPPHPLGVLGGRDQHPAARDLAQLDPGVARGVAGAELPQRLGDVGGRRLERFREQALRQRLVGGEEQRLDRSL